MLVEDENDPHNDAKAEHVSSKLMVCGHVFGKNCITYWLKESTTCPLCRRRVYLDPNAESESESESDEGDNATVSDPVYVLYNRPWAIITLGNLIDNNTVPLAIVVRALDLILRNTLEYTRPIHPWWWLLMQLPSVVPQLAVGGWASWIYWLEKDVIERWENIPGDPRWYDYEERMRFRETALEAQPMTQTIRSEVDICREIMGWEALPECQFWWV